MTADIRVQNLVKHYLVAEREGGLVASLKGVFRRRHRRVRAVDGITFDVPKGEIVGFLGPNGAGKTTALKVLSGLLYPTDGEVAVLGHVPWQRKREFLVQMTLIMGQRQQLFWDLPGIDTFLVNKAIFGIEKSTYQSSLGRLSEMLELDGLLNKPVRQLSLGERMKVEFAAGLLHSPSVLFLDEPTLGLDVTMQQRIRQFIKDYNTETGATILLTSHYMADVKALAERVIVIDQGRVLYDGLLQGLVDRYAPHKTITMHFERPVDVKDLERYGEVNRIDDLQFQIRTPKDAAPAATARLLADLPISDLSVEDPALEDVIDHVFRAAPK